MAKLKNAAAQKEGKAHRANRETHALTGSSALAEKTLYLFVFLSGAVGLLYEVTWHRYLAILLGAQARATAMILAVFLGGMSIGYAFFGKWSRRTSKNLLGVYAFVEIGMGLWGLCFPFLFHLGMPLTSRFYAWLGVQSLAVDILMSILLIGFPTFLMGSTLPLLTQGLSPDLNGASRTHAKLYGWNTIGACLGALLTGYFLIPLTSLSATSRSGAILNFLIAGAFYFYFKRWAFPPPSPKEDEIADRHVFSLMDVAPLFGIAFLSGFSLITLETVLVRLMGLTAGSSHYNFTLIVSIFIFTLGIGSLVLKRINRVKASFLFWNEVISVLLLLGLYVSVDHWSYWVHLVRSSLRDQSELFFLYQALLAVLFGGLLIFPLGASGLTLPLCFHLLKEKRETLGQKVGQLYSINTLGCVLGAVVGGYWVLEYLDLDGLFKLCLFFGALSAALSGRLYFVEHRRFSVSLVGGALLTVLACVGTIFAPLFDKNRFTQPFRHTQPIEGVTYEGAQAWAQYLARATHYVFWKDGPNTSVGIGKSEYNGQEISRSILINGKSDGNTRAEILTTAMMGQLPALLAKDPKRACVIGFGTGISIGNLLKFDEVERIDVLEISGTVIKASPLLDRYDGEVSKSKRVVFHEMDAMRFLEGTTQKFDAISSEPSNPWVTGIENLYSREFYEISKRKMSEEGVFVQWLHTYSFNDDLFKLVMRTMGSVFPYVSVMQLTGSDLALVGRTKPLRREDLLRAEKRLEKNPPALAAMVELGIHRFETVLALELVPPPLTRVIASEGPIQTLESPKLSNGAARAFFAGTSAHIKSLRREYRQFFPSVKESLLSLFLGGETPDLEMLGSFRQSFCEEANSRNSILCSETLAMIKYLNPRFDPSSFYEMPKHEMAALQSFDASRFKLFSTKDLDEIHTVFEIYKKYYSPIAQFPTDRIMAPLNSCLRTTFKSTELYGECLLQKILVLEASHRRTAEYLMSIDEYLKWFPSLATSAPDYDRLKEAQQILSHIKD